MAVVSPYGAPLPRPLPSAGSLCVARLGVRCGEGAPHAAHASEERGALFMTRMMVCHALSEMLPCYLRTMNSTCDSWSREGCGRCVRVCVCGRRRGA